MSATDVPEAVLDFFRTASSEQMFALMSNPVFQRNEEGSLRGSVLEVPYLDLPEAVRHVAVYDAQLNPLRNGHVSFANLYRKCRDEVVIGVIGGTKLEGSTVPRKSRRYFHLNQKLAELFARAPLPAGGVGWSFITGQGPGRAMTGPHCCLQKARRRVAQCRSKCIAVPSALNDEPPHTFADEDYVTTPQSDIIMRELMLIMLASDGIIVYPGNLGTGYELYLSLLINYVAGRMPVSLPPRPVIIVDQGSDEERSMFFKGKSFWGPLKHQRANAERMGLTKTGMVSGTHWIDVNWRNCHELIVSHLLSHLRENRGLVFDGELHDERH